MVENQCFTSWLKSSTPDTSSHLENILFMFYDNVAQETFKIKCWVLLHLNLNFPWQALPRLLLCSHLTYAGSLCIMLGHYFCTTMLLLAAWCNILHCKWGSMSYKYPSFTHTYECCCPKAASISITFCILS